MSAAISPRVPHGDQNIDLLAVDTIRTLSMDGVRVADSGHPGTRMALAPVAYCLWQQFLRFDPQDPIWPNRDRFVLSIGWHILDLATPLTYGGRRQDIRRSGAK